LPTDTHHVLKFRKDPFRGVDRIDSKKPLQNRCRRHYSRRPIKWHERLEVMHTVLKWVVGKFTGKKWSGWKNINRRKTIWWSSKH